MIIHSAVAQTGEIVHGRRSHPFRLVVLVATTACTVTMLTPLQIARAADASTGDTAAPAPTWTPGDEVLSMRDRWGSTVNGATEGTYVSTVHSKPVNFQATDGSWQPIDLTLKTTPGGLRPTANDVAPILSLTGSSANLVNFTLAGTERIQFGLSGALPVPAIASGSTVQYASILPGVDAKFDLRSNGVKETLVLHSADAPTSYDFPLSLSDLSAISNGDGGIDLVDPLGQRMGWVPPGEMTDAHVDPASGDPASSSDVSYQLLPNPAGGTMLHVALSSAWLHDPARVFPVSVDPSIYNVAYSDTADDAYVQSTGGYSDTDTVLKSGTFDGNDKSRSFMHFAGVSTFDGRQINSATLNVWENWSFSCTTRGVRAWPIAANWDGATSMTWPGISVRSYSSTYVPEAVVAHGHDSGCPAANVPFTVTQTVKNWANNTWPNYGLALISTSETDDYGWKKWDSNEASHNPALTVNWTNSAPAQVAGRSITPNDCVYNCSGPTDTKDTTPVLHGTTTDPDAQLLRYDFEVYPGHLTTVDSSGNATPGSVARLQAGSVSGLASGAAANWTVPTGLADGDYSYRVRAYDTELYSVWSSGWSQFTVDSGPPPAPTITSSTHPDDTAYYNAATINAAWQSIAPSGTNGYTTVLDTLTGTDPGTGTASPTSAGTFSNEPDSCYYLHARPQNDVGTWGSVSQKRMCIDTTAPNPPTSFYSTSHTVNGPSNNTIIAVTGSGASDPLANNSASGIGGYSVAFNNSSTTAADTIQDVAGTSFNQSSTSLADGTWYAHVRSLDLAGNVSSDVVNGPYLIDTVAPAAPIPTSSQASSGAWTPNNAITFNWAAPSDVSGIGGYSAVLDQTQGTVPPASTSTTGTSVNYSNLADGTYYFHLRAVDKAGNWGTTYLFTLLVDSSAPLAPTVGSSTHPSETQWSSNDAPSFTFSDGDLSSVTGLSYVIDTSPSTLPDTTAEVNGASGSVSYTGRPEGHNWFHVRAKNGSGLWGAAYNYAINIDHSAPTIAPTVSSTSHTAGAASNQQVLYLNWTSAPGYDPYSGVAGYSVAINNSATTAADTTQDQTGTTFAYTMPTEGDYYFHIRAIDALGYVGTDAVTGPWRLDVTAPGATTITSSTHTQNVWSPNSTGTFNLSASDLNGIGGYSVLLDENQTSTPPTSITTTASNYTKSAIADGTHYVHARAVDVAGNWGSSSVYTILVDATGPVAPSVSSSTHPDQSAWSTTNTAGFAFSGNDLSGITGWSYVMDRSPSTTPDTTTELGATTSGTATFANLPDGLNYFHVRAVNGTGLFGATTTYLVRIDRSAPEVAPTVTSSSHQVSTPSNNTNLQLGWANAPGSDAYSGIAGYSIAINTLSGTAADSTIDLSGTSYTYTLPGEGSYYIHIRAIDAVGNVGPDTVTGPYVIDLTSPLAPVISSSTHSQTIWSTSPDATCTWTLASDPSGISGYSVLVDQSLVTVPATTINTTSATWTANALPDGISYVHVRARDGAGNWGPASTYTLKVDTSPPAAPSINSSTHPVQGAWSANGDPTFTVGASDVSGIAGYGYVLDQTATTVPPASVTIAGTNISGSGLADGQWYLHVRAINGSGLASLTSTYNIAVDRTGPTAATISSLSHEAGVMTDHRVLTADWTQAPSTDALSGLAGYNVTINTDPALLGGNVVNNTSGSYTSDSLADGTYWLHVRGVDVVGNVGQDAAFGPIVIDATHGFPYPVQDVLAEAADGMATISWSPVDDNGSPNLGYTVTADPGGATIDVGGPVLSTTLSGLDNGVPYTFTVNALNANGTSLVSAPSLAVVPFGQVGAVQDVVAEEVAPYGLHVQWLPGELNGNQDATFDVTLSPGGATRTVHLSNDEGDGSDDPAAVVERTDTTFSDLAPGTYTATVVATGTNGIPASAVTSDPVLVRGDLPEAPTSLTATPQDGQVLLAWAPAVDHGSAITEYEVINEADGSTQYVDGSDASTTIDGLTDGTAYAFDVYATNDLGQSPNFARAVATPADTGVATAVNAATPSNVQASTAGCASCARVSWTAPKAAVPGVTGYTITTYLKSNNSAVGTPATSTTTSVTMSGGALGLPGTYGKWVYFKVATHTAAGTVPNTESNKSRDVKPGKAPDPPGSLSAVSGRSVITLTYPTPANNGSPIRNYRVQINDGSTTVERKIGSSPAKIKGLTLGTHYTFTVKAENAYGTGGASPSASALFRDAPLAPSTATASRNGTGVSVTWDAATQRGEPITKYVAHLENSNQSVTRDAGDPRSATFSGLRAGTTYRVDVTAYSAVGRGGTVVSNDVTIAGPPGTPPNFKAVPGPAKVDLSWSGAAANGATVTSYDLYRDDNAGHLTLENVSRDTRSKSVTGLTAGHTYTFTLYANNSEGNSGPARANATPTSGSAEAPKPTHPSGNPGTAGDLRNKLASDAQSVSSAGKHHEHEWNDGDCNWFTEQLGRGGTKETNNNVSPVINSRTGQRRDTGVVACDTDPHPIYGPAVVTRSEEWCADFSTWVLQQSGVSTEYLTAAANTFYKWAHHNGHVWHDQGLAYTPRKGDFLVWFSGTETNPGHGHVAIIISVDSTGVWAVGGNAGANDRPGSSDAAYKHYKNIGSGQTKMDFASIDKAGREIFRGFAAPTA
jgi:hypothetical protein